MFDWRITGDLKFDFWGIQETRIEKVTPMTNKWLVDSLIRNQPTLGAKWSQSTGTARWVRASNLLGEQPPLGGPCLGTATPLLSQVFRTSGPYCSFPLSPVQAFDQYPSYHLWNLNRFGSLYPPFSDRHWRDLLSLPPKFLSLLSILSNCFKMGIKKLWYPEITCLIPIWFCLKIVVPVAPQIRWFIMMFTTEIRQKYGIPTVYTVYVPHFQSRHLMFHYNK